MKEALHELGGKQFNPGRRKFSKVALANILCGSALLSETGCSAGEKQESVSEKKEPAKNTSDIRLSQVTSARVSDETILFFKQLGLKYVDVSVRGSEYDLTEVKRRFEKEGITVEGVVNPTITTGDGGDKIRMGFEGRDEEIERLKIFIRDMNKAGIHKYNMQGWAPIKRGHGGAYKRTGVTRFCPATVFDYEKSQQAPNFFDRAYEAEEMWDNFAYFAERIIPVAEENNVKLGMHPDKPIPQCNGIPYIFNTFENYKRAVEITNNSKNFGMTLCIGQLAPGVDDMLEVTRYFAERGRIFHVHFRNVDSHAPPWVETFPDNGFVDMYQIIKILTENGYQGTVVPDHIPSFEGSSAGEGVGLAYCTAYTRGLIEAASKEFESS